MPLEDERARSGLVCRWLWIPPGCVNLSCLPFRNDGEGLDMAASEEGGGGDAVRMSYLTAFWIIPSVDI
jgi:hypothetical protein